MTYYGVAAEYYKDGSRKCGIITKQKGKKPITVIKWTPISTVFQCWFSKKYAAEIVKKNIDHSVFTKDDMYRFWAEFKTEEVAA